MKAYRLDLRQKLMQALAQGQRPFQVAAAFGVGGSTVKRSRQQVRETGSLAPKPIPGDTPSIPPEQYPLWRAQVARQPDATLAEHCALWAAEQGVRVSVSTMCRMLAKLGLPLKNSASSRANATTSGARRGGRKRPALTPAGSSSSTRAARTSA